MGKHVIFSFIFTGELSRRITNSKLSRTVAAGMVGIALICSMVSCGETPDEDDAEAGDIGVDISDAALRAAIASTLEIQDDTSITVDDMLKLTHFDLDIDIDIANLTGLEYATNLESLDLYYNVIVDVSPLKELTKLESLGLGYNVIVDVSPLKDLTNLEALALEHNAIIDVSPLKELKNLTWLDLGHNAIVDVSPLKELTKLEEFFLGHNAIVDVSPLKELKNLKSLILSENPLSHESVEIHIPAIEANGTTVIYDF